MAALKALEVRTYVNGAKIEFRDVDSNILNFKEQIKTDLGTSFLYYSMLVYVYVALDR